VLLSITGGRCFCTGPDVAAQLSENQERKMMKAWVAGKKELAILC